MNFLEHVFKLVKLQMDTFGKTQPMRGKTNEGYITRPLRDSEEML